MDRLSRGSSSLWSLQHIVESCDQARRNSFAADVPEQEEQQEQAVVGTGLNPAADIPGLVSLPSCSLGGEASSGWSLQHVVDSCKGVLRGLRDDRRETPVSAHQQDVTGDFIRIVSNPTIASSPRINDECIRNNSQKIMPATEPASYIRIGHWKLTAEYPNHIVTKWQYSRRTFIWEISDGRKLKRMVIKWPDIRALRAKATENNIGTLELELSKPPEFSERKDHPGHRTAWEKTGDFTEGGASTYRIHLLRYSPGKLDSCLSNLLASDPRLRELRQQPFPHYPYEVFGSLQDNQEDATTRGSLARQ